MEKITYSDLRAEGYRVEKVVKTFGGLGDCWYAYGPKGFNIKAPTKGRAVTACREHFEDVAKQDCVNP